MAHLTMAIQVRPDRLRLGKVFHLFTIVALVPEDAAALQGLTQRNAFVMQRQEEARGGFTGVIDMIVIFIALAEPVTQFGGHCACHLAAERLSGLPVFPDVLAGEFDHNVGTKADWHIASFADFTGKAACFKWRT
jgi:hypothetical protein